VRATLPTAAHSDESQVCTARMRLPALATWLLDARCSGIASMIHYKGAGSKMVVRRVGDLDRWRVPLMDMAPANILAAQNVCARAWNWPKDSSTPLPPILVCMQFAAFHGSVCVTVSVPKRQRC
jgi:hypothetical protein